MFVNKDQDSQNVVHHTKHEIQTFNKLEFEYLWYCRVVVIFLKIKMDTDDYKQTWILYIYSSFSLDSPHR